MLRPSASGAQQCQSHDPDDRCDHRARPGHEGVASSATDPADHAVESRELNTSHRHGKPRVPLAGNPDQEAAQRQIIEQLSRGGTELGDQLLSAGGTIEQLKDDKLGIWNHQMPAPIGTGQHCTPGHRPTFDPINQPRGAIG